MRRISAGSLILVSVIVLTSVALVVLSPGVNAQKPSVLFSLDSVPQVKTDGEKNSPASVKESIISFNFEQLTRNGSAKLNIPLFDGKIYTATQNVTEGFESRGMNNFTWRGKITAGNFNGDVVLTVNNGFVSGLIHSPAGIYEIAAIGSRQILIQLDQSLFSECAGEVGPPVVKENAAPAEPGTVSDSGDRIDVLVVYTEAVKNAVGGDTQAQTLAQSAVDISNTAYRNSKIRQRLRLVHSSETRLTEANSLSELRSDIDTQNLRNTHKADMVAMLVNSLSGCGVAYVMTNVGTGFESSAYSITLRTCAVGNLTFAHELGHNMGSTHDPANGGTAAYPFSYGHYVNGSYRSVMSYSTECTSGCTRVAQFSNPAIVFNGVPTGILYTRNNARSIENTADTVSNFRYSGASISLNNYSENAFIPRNISKTVNWSTNNVSGNIGIEISLDEGTTWESLVADTPNDGSQVINVNSRPTKRVRIRVSSVEEYGIRDSSVRNISIQ